MAILRGVDVVPEQEVLPGVSYVMPVLNEVQYLERAVHSILDQDYPGPTEIVLALGPSTDGTDAVVKKLVTHDPRIRTVDNPKAAIPSALNLAIKASSHPVIVRVDAHAQLPAGYTHRAVQTLLRVNADNVGGIMSAVGREGVQKAIARAYNSRYGLGGGAYHSVDVPEGPAESAYLGVMRASALAEIGGYDESIQRGEDWEMNFRLRQAGHLVWLDPTLHVRYWPRSSWTALSKQFLSTGIWRGELVRRLHGRHPLRFYAPPALVTLTVASVVLAPLGAVFGGWLGWLALATGAADLAYLVLLAVASLQAPDSLRDRLRFAGVLATMHFSWGLGFLRGLTHGGRQHHVDRSRHT
jgi:succinoglycan biosynthesis protein ExoA